jgi:protein kinase A
MTLRFRIEDVEVFHTIGRGGYGRVKIARSRSTSVFFALKAMKKSHLINSKQVDHVHSELEIMKSLNHPFIVRLLGYSQDEIFLYFALEFISGGDLFTYIKLNKGLSLAHSSLLSSQIVLTLSHLHSKSIVYRDLKPENLLIRPNGYLKLTDFGLAKVISHRTQTFCGTAEYMAPEIIRNLPYGTAVDWWSFGVIIYEMITGIDPFHDPDPMVVYSNVLNGKVKFPKGFDSNAKSLVKHLLVSDLSKRYGNMKRGVQDIKRHMFFRDVEWELLEFQMVPMPYLPNVKFQGDTSNFFKYPESDTSDEGPLVEDPFENW